MFFFAVLSGIYGILYEKCASTVFTYELLGCVYHIHTEQERMLFLSCTERHSSFYQLYYILNIS